MCVVLICVYVWGRRKAADGPGEMEKINWNVRPSSKYTESGNEV
jgi:hypothetical protein